jgi:hypothetical protein
MEKQSVAFSKTLVADINEAMKDSGERALKRHVAKGLPIVTGNDKGESVLLYADGRREVLKKNL